jgi:hypothetical protein
MMDAHGRTVSDVSLSFTALSSTAAVMAVVAGKALQYLQPRTLLLLGGVIFGAGVACLGFAHSLGAL